MLLTLMLLWSLDPVVQAQPSAGSGTITVVIDTAAGVVPVAIQRIYRQ